MNYALTVVSPHTPGRARQLPAEISYECDNYVPSTPTQFAFVNSFQTAAKQLFTELPPDTSVFSSTCLTHCLTDQATFYTFRVNGITPQEAVRVRVRLRFGVTCHHTVLGLRQPQPWLDMNGAAAVLPSLCACPVCDGCSAEKRTGPRGTPPLSHSGMVHGPREGDRDQQLRGLRVHQLLWAEHAGPPVQHGDIRVPAGACAAQPPRCPTCPFLDQCLCVICP